MPADGFVQLAAAPGDVVDQVHVTVGDQVSAGDKLVTMRSEAVRQKQLDALRQQLIQAQREQQRVVAGAVRKVQAAELKLQHIASQQSALERQNKLLDLAKQQVESSQQVLHQLRTIARDALTSEFVGQLEIDRQALAVGDAELKYQQQKEQHNQASEDLNWAEKAAELELETAREMLASAEAAEPLSAIRSEIETLEEQSRSALMLAPSDGLIVAVNANPGEASIQMPLVELANVEQMVCEVEINDMDAARVTEGDAATIRSRAFGDVELQGRVKHKYSMVGRPQLKPLDPLARADYRSVTAVVELEPGKSAEFARQWLQLQVEVEIRPNQTAPAKASTPASSADEDVNATATPETTTP